MSAITGEDRAWEVLSEMDPEEVCGRTGATFDRNGKIYSIVSFGRTFSIDPQNRRISGTDKDRDLFLGKLAYFFRISVLVYLLKARDIAPSGELVKPAGIAGGGAFFRGTHALPLDAVANRYSGDAAGFVSRGLLFGGEAVEYGDSALRLYPLPKVPVIIILWSGDEEWPPRADLLFDSTISRHLPIDIIWSVGMMSLLVFLQ